MAYKFGNLTVIPQIEDAKTVYVKDVPVRLTSAEFEFLTILVHNSGTALSKGTLLAKMYGKDQPEPKIIDVFVCKIRKKLRRIGGENFIETIENGYRLPKAERVAA